MSIFDDLPPDHVQAQSAAFDAPRRLVASATRLPINAKSTRKEVTRTSSRVWQRAAWDYYDTIGEVNFGFNLLGSVMNRIRLYPGMIAERNKPPVDVAEWEDQTEEFSSSVAELRIEGSNALQSLDEGYVAGGLGELQRSFALNLSVAGEMFLVQPESGLWILASIEELVTDPSSKGGFRIKSDRDGSVTNSVRVKKGSYIARIWRGHPRWRKEAMSSMLAVLDQCEKLMLLDRALRSNARTRMHANMMFIPEGITVSSLAEEESDEDAIENLLIEGLTAPIADEAAVNSVVPLFLRGPADLGEKIRYIEIGKDYDPNLMAAATDALDRVLQGIDIPKDVVTGLANVKYANAIVLSDDMYRAHVEPLCLALVDALTSVYYRPYLRKAGIPEALVRRAVIWFDPSMVVTRPDRSAAANEGYDRQALSKKAWRTSRGYTEDAAPDMDELLLRLAFEKTVLPPDTAVAVLKHFAPDVFAKVQAQSQQESGFPPEVSTLLNPTRQQPPGAAPNPPNGQSAAENTTPKEAPGGPAGAGGNGGQPAPGGTRPPTQAVPGGV